MLVTDQKSEYRTFGENGVTYEVLEIKENYVVLRVVLTDEIVDNYPISDYLKDPAA